MPDTRPCEIWCERAKQRRKVSSVIAIDWENFSFVRVNGPALLESHGQKTISTASGFTSGSIAHYLGEVEHTAERIAKLEQTIDEAVAQAAPEIRAVAVIEALQALRGVAQTTATTVVPTATKRLGQQMKFFRTAVSMTAEGLRKGESL